MTQLHASSVVRSQRIVLSLSPSAAILVISKKDSLQACGAILQAIVDEHKQEAAQQTAQPAALSPTEADSSPQHGNQAPSSPLQTPAHAVTTVPATTPAPQGAATPAGPPSSSAAAAAPAAAAAAAAISAALDMTPAANVVSSPAATFVPASLLRHTQAANLLTGSPLAATPATRANSSTNVRQADAPPSQTRPLAAAGMHAPSQATQNTEVSSYPSCECILSPGSALGRFSSACSVQQVVLSKVVCCIEHGELDSLLWIRWAVTAVLADPHDDSLLCLHQEADREIQELLAWMRQDEGSSDEEGDMLMALADQAGPTPKSAGQRSSQQVLHTHLFVDKAFLYVACDRTGQSTAAVASL